MKQVVENKGLDLKSLSAGPDALVYEQFGGIYVFDPGSGKVHEGRIFTSPAILPATRPHYEKVGRQDSECGNFADRRARGVRSARRNPERARRKRRRAESYAHDGVAERDPAWSPDGKSIAYFSDESGEYALHLVDQSGLGHGEENQAGSATVVFLWTDVVARQQEDRLHGQAPELLVRGCRERAHR